MNPYNLHTTEQSPTPKEEVVANKVIIGNIDSIEETEVTEHYYTQIRDQFDCVIEIKEFVTGCVFIDKVDIQKEDTAK